jgi:hypothetical protein
MDTYKRGKENQRQWQQSPHLNQGTRLTLLMTTQKAIFRTCNNHKQKIRVDRLFFSPGKQLTDLE